MGRLMSSIGATPLPNQKEIVAMYRKEFDKFVDLFYAEYQTAGQKTMTPEEFKMEVKSKDDNWCVSKYLACFVFNKIKGRENQFLNMLLRYAKSESVQSAVHLKVK